MKKKLKLTLVLIISTFLLASSLLIAYASEDQTDTQNYGYYLNDVDLDNWTYLNAPYFMPSAYAVYSWNHPPALCGCEMTPSTSSLNKVYAQSLPPGVGGEWIVLLLGGTPHHQSTKFSITINTYYEASSSNFLQGEFCHEMGHALGLYDDSSNQWSIMNWYRDRETVYTPFVTDCYGLYYIWSME